MNITEYEDIYAGERGDILCGSCGSDTSKLTWIGKVALMYPSDEFIISGKFCQIMSEL